MGKINMPEKDAHKIKLTKETSMFQRRRSRGKRR